MPVLCDADILAAIKRQDLAIEPFAEASLTPNGYDLRIAELLLPDETGAAPVRDGKVTVPPKARFLVSTLERVTLGPAVTAQLWIRSSFARKGLFASFGKVEAGFSGTLTIGGFNAAAVPIEIPVGDRFCQIAFEELTRPAEKPYVQRSGRYQNQQGVTLARE
ncbi:MAG TPA: dCTP deaminase [Candidatus Thermoplasmatota archaeon]|nr:dCTP deaminase [Candidatus Thermoplasmatota archaeon]